MKMIEFLFKFHLNLFNNPTLVRVLALRRTGGNPLPDPVHRRIYAPLGGDE